MSDPNAPARILAPALRVTALVVAASAALAACGSSSDDDSGFSLATTDQAASPNAPLALADDLMVYLASEGFSGPAGTDHNTDGDTADQVAFAVNLSSRVETNLGVAAQRVEILGLQIYLVVSEVADGTDWNTDLDTTDFVLLHASEAAGTVTFVDLVEDGAVPVVAGDRLFYESAGALTGVPDETRLRALDEANPTASVPVLAEVGGLLRGTPPAVVRPLREDSGLLFCAADEAAIGVDYNGDLDNSDETVLVLLDATDASARLIGTDLALRDDAQPLDAIGTAAGDWLVAFLVDEAEQGNTNLNDQALFSQPLLPENCPTSDSDTLDQVLHFAQFSALEANTPAVNTGIAGGARVLAIDGSSEDFVATISSEAEADCNLNAGAGGTVTTADTDTADFVARWVATTAPIAPEREAADLHALATATGGGSLGLSVLDDRLIAVIDEEADGRNNDGKIPNHDLVAWLDPAATDPAWDFSHQHPSNRSFGTGVFDDDGDSEPFAGTTWMAAEAVGDRLGIVFLEEVPGTNPDVGSLNTNLDCGLVQKDSDKVDGLPVWADFEAGPTLDFDGMGYAVDLTNAGIEIAVSHAFFRVSESADNRDYNADGDKLDVVLFRNPLTTCGPIAMATSSLVAGQAITTDGSRGAGFLSSETQAGLDFNEDGDETDLVWRYFRF